MYMDESMANVIKTPIQRGGTVFVYNGNGKLVETHSTLELGKAFFNTSNDIFYEIYGFNFVPKDSWWERCKRAAGKM